MHFRMDRTGNTIYYCCIIYYSRNVLNSRSLPSTGCICQNAYHHDNLKFKHTCSIKTCEIVGLQNSDGAVLG
jgi:hypothetical protein